MLRAPRPIGRQIGADALGNPVLFGAIYDPKSTQVVNGQIVRTPFTGNIIPQNRIDPVAAAIIGKAGLTAPTYDKMILNTPRIDTSSPFFNQDVYTVKFDHNISDKEHFSALYNHEYRDRDNNGASRFLPIPGPPTSTWQDQYTPSRMARASLDSTFTPTLINRVSIGFNRFLNQNGAPLALLNQHWASQIGIQNTAGTVFPDFNFNGPDYQGGTIAKIGVGWFGAAANGSYIVNDDLTKIHGKHTFHFGHQYSRYYYNERNYSDAGNFNFYPNQSGLTGYATETGNSFASFLLGAPRDANHGISVLSDGFRQPYHEFDANDDIKLTPKLTVNLGFHWGIIPPFYERTDRMSYIDLSAPNSAAGNLPGVLVFRNRPSDTYWGQIGPRLGVAYQASNKVVVRGGYAILNTPPITNGWGYGGFTTGYNATVTAAKGTSPTGFVDDPALYMSQPFPSLGFSLPFTDPADTNFNAGATTRPYANRPGYTQNWNFTVQYQLPKDTLAEVAYVGNKGTRLFGFGQLNTLPASMLSMGDALNAPASSYPNLIPYAGFPTDLSVAQALRPYPMFYGVNEAYPYNLNSSYNALLVQVTKHQTGGFGFIAAYTWSKTIGYDDSMGATQYGTRQDYSNTTLERSVTGFNMPQTFKLTWSYDLPIGKSKPVDLHWANWALGGWQLSGIHNYLSGLPVVVSQGGLNMPAGFGSIRPDVLNGAPVSLGGVPGKVDYSEPVQWVNPAAFASVPMTGNGVPLRVGTAPRTLPYLSGPRTMTEAVRMSKTFPIYQERVRFKLGATWLNPFKRTVPYITDTTVGDPLSARCCLVAEGAVGRSPRILESLGTHARKAPASPPGLFLAASALPVLSLRRCCRPPWSTSAKSCILPIRPGLAFGGANILSTFISLPPIYSRSGRQWCSPDLANHTATSGGGE